MATTQGLSFFTANAGDNDLSVDTLTYGFDVLSSDDITVVGLYNNETERVLFEGNGTHYTLDTTNQTVTNVSGLWIDDDLTDQYNVTTIRVYRTTSVNELIDFKSGAVLSESDLDVSYKQGIFAAQEFTEDASGTGTPQVVSGTQLTNLSVATAKLADSSITTAKIADDAITSDKLLQGAVDTNAIANLAVSTQQLDNQAVTALKLDTDSVVTAKIEDDAVTYEKVDVASSAEMEGQTAAGVVTPDVLKYSPLSPRCYGTVSYAVAGTATVGDGAYNVNVTATQDATEQVAGNRRIYFDTPMSDTNYVVMASMTDTADKNAEDFAIQIYEKHATYFQVFTSEAAQNTRAINFVVFGSTLDES